MKRRGHRSEATMVNDHWGCGNRRTIRPTGHRSSPASFGVTSDFQRCGCVHVENLLPDFRKRKSSPSILESEPCKSKIGTVSVEFRTQKFLGTVPGTKSRFRDKKTPTRVSFLWRQDWSNSFSSSGVFTLHTTASGRDVPSRETACPPTDWNSRPTRCSPAARAA